MANENAAWSISKMLSWIEQYFVKHNIENSKYEAEALLAYSLKMQRMALYLEFQRSLTLVELSKIKETVKTRIMGVPLAYIIGEAYFWNINLKVTKDVLIPRPDSEVLVQTALNLIDNDSPSRLVDWGTGSGAIALAIALERPKSKVLALDISAQAIELARNNFELIKSKFPNSEPKLEFVHSDGFKGVTGADFDMIIANPPYISTTEYASLSKECLNEPKLALLAGDAGLDCYIKILAESPAKLKKGGYLVLEHGAKQREALTKLFAGEFKLEAAIDDLAAKARVLVFSKN